MKFLAEYIKKLLKTWIFYLGIIPTFYDFANTYIKLDFEFSNKFLLIWANFWIIYTSYEIWKKEKEEKNKLLEELEKLKYLMPKYEVKLILKKYEFEEIKEFENKKSKLLIKAKKQLELLENVEKLDELKGYEIEEIFDFLPIENQNDLEKYKQDLKDFITKVQNLQIDESIKNTKFYTATLQISNIGNKSDEDIYCEIELGEENFAFEDIEKFEEILDEIKTKKIPHLPEFPIPIRKIENNLPKISNFDILGRAIKSNIIIKPQHISKLNFHNLHPPYFFVEEHSLKVTKLNLNVELVHEKDFYLILKDEKNISYFITSKNLKEPQKGKVKVEYET